MWGVEIGKWGQRVMGEVLTLYGRMFDLYRNGVYSTLDIIVGGQTTN